MKVNGYWGELEYFEENGEMGRESWGGGGERERGEGEEEEEKKGGWEGV